MKKLFIAAIMSLSLLTTSTFAEVKMGIILGFTGPIESLTPAMRDSAKLAFQKTVSPISIFTIFLEKTICSFPSLLSMSIVWSDANTD